MKRTRSSARLETGSSSRGEENDIERGVDYEPSASAPKKRKQSGSPDPSVGPRRNLRSGSTAQRPSAAATVVPGGAVPDATANANAASRRSLRTPRTPQTSTQAGTAVTAGATAAGAAIATTSRRRFKKNLELPSAISPNARLPACNLGAVEFLAFFPLHMQWPELGLRLYRNGWSALVISLAELHARNQLDYKSDDAVEKRRAAHRPQVISNGKHFFNDPNFTPTSRPDLLTPVNTYDATNYSPRNTRGRGNLFPARLVDIASGVKNWPMGEDCGIVTQAIMHAVNNDLQHLTTADIPQLAQQLGLQDPADSLGSQWDQNACQRIQARIELTGNYRKRSAKGEGFAAAYQDEDWDEDVGGYESDFESNSDDEEEEEEDDDDDDDDDDDAE